MLELIPPGLNIDFVRKAKFFITVSLLIIVLGVISLIVHGGLNQGIDFSGGTLVQVRLSQPADLGVIREALTTLGVGTAVVQQYGDAREVLIRVAQHTAAGQDIGPQVQHTLQDRLGGQPIALRRVEVVGPQASADLRQKALFALFYATLGTVAYISGRFEGKWVISVSLTTILFVVTYGLTSHVIVKQ